MSFVLPAPDKVEERVAILETWGNYANGFHLLVLLNSSRVALVGQLGNAMKSSDKREIMLESETIQDVAFDDNIGRNLTWIK